MTEPWGSTWTDERIAQLRDLLAQGLSARVIAGRLGVTRNAVIGKVSRLGLSGQGNPPGPPKGQKAMSRASLRAAKEAAAKPGSVGSVAFGVVSGIKRRQRAAAGPALEIDIEPAPIDAVVPMGQRLSLQELNEATCHWPIGHPGNPEFFFCGGKTLPGLPYCAGHSSIAYRPAHDRRRPQPGRGLGR